MMLTKVIMNTEISCVKYCNTIENQKLSSTKFINRAGGPSIRKMYDGGLCDKSLDNKLTSNLCIDPSTVHRVS